VAGGVRLRLIEVREVDPSEGVEPLHWRLLTTHTIADAAGAWEIVGWYQLRWVIEQLFRVIKSQGLQLEDSQVAPAERLVKLAAAATEAACIDIQLTQGRDGTDHMPASNVFTDAFDVVQFGRIFGQPSVTPSDRRHDRPCGRSRSTGISVHHPLELAFTINWN
jgi:hypothetical protein